MTFLDRASAALNEREAQIARENRRRDDERDGNLRRQLISFVDELVPDDETIGVDVLSAEDRAEAVAGAPRFVTDVDGNRVGIDRAGRIMFEWIDDGERGWFGVDVRGQSGDGLLVSIARQHALAVENRRAYRRRKQAEERRSEEATTYRSEPPMADAVNLTRRVGGRDDGGCIVDWWTNDPVVHALPARPHAHPYTACGTPRRSWERIPLRHLLKVGRPCRRCWTENP